MSQNITGCWKRVHNLNDNREGRRREGRERSRVQKARKKGIHFSRWWACNALDAREGRFVCSCPFALLLLSVCCCSCCCCCFAWLRFWSHITAGRVHVDCSLCPLRRTLSWRFLAAILHATLNNSTKILTKKNRRVRLGLSLAAGATLGQRLTTY